MISPTTQLRRFFEPQEDFHPWRLELGGAVCVESSRILKKTPSSVDELSGAMIFTKTSMGVEKLAIRSLERWYIKDVYRPQKSNIDTQKMINMAIFLKAVHLSKA